MDANIGSTWTAGYFYTMLPVPYFMSVGAMVGGWARDGDGVLDGMSWENFELDERESGR